MPTPHPAQPQCSSGVWGCEGAGLTPRGLRGGSGSYPQSCPTSFPAEGKASGSRSAGTCVWVTSRRCPRSLPLGSSAGLCPGSCSPRCHLHREEVGVVAQRSPACLPVSHPRPPSPRTFRHLPVWSCRVVLRASARLQRGGPGRRGPAGRGGEGGVTEVG